MITIERPSDGWEWTAFFGPGVTTVPLPALGLLGAGSYEIQTTLVGSSTVPYTRLEELPASFREGIAVLDFISTSASIAVSAN